MTDMLVESRIRGNMYVRFGGEYKETSHRNMKRRHILSLLNHLPNHHNTYGFDIDGKAVAVARYLYPDAHIESAISGSITQNNALTPLSAIRLSI